MVYDAKISSIFRSFKCKPETQVYIQSYFVAIATILGTGILGMPVTLDHAGFYPFIMIFFLGYIFQGLAVIFFVDILQRNSAAYTAGIIKKSSDIHKQDTLEMADDQKTDDSNAKDKIEKKYDYSDSEDSNSSASLHVVGEMFLSKIFCIMFDILLIVLFTSILISYSLAGSGAYAQLIKTESLYIIPAFVGILTFIIMTAENFIQPVISILTLTKGLMLSVTIAIALYVGSYVQQPLTHDYSHIGEALLMATVALGGTVNIMPLMFCKLRNKKEQVERFRFALLAAVTTCLILNIIWTWSVMAVVPQMPCTLSNSTTVCKSNISLHQAKMDGSIATVPLTSIIERNHKSFKWIAILIQVFIVISITVSYLTVGAAFLHTLKGYIDSKSSGNSLSCTSCPKFFNDARKWKIIMPLFVFCIVLTITMVNPSGFVEVLDKGVSFCLNFEHSVFVFLMSINSRRGPFKSLTIPSPLHPKLYITVYLLPLFFGFCVIFDIAQVILEALKGKDVNIFVW